MYIDPETCIDCGACVPECPYEAIFPEDEVPAAHTAKAGQKLSSPTDGAFAGKGGHYSGHNNKSEAVELEGVVELAGGETVNLSGDVQKNYEFYKGGPGYGAK